MVIIITYVGDRLAGRGRENENESAGGPLAIVKRWASGVINKATKHVGKLQPEQALCVTHGGGRHHEEGDRYFDRREVRPCH